MPSDARGLHERMIAVLPRVRRFAFALTASPADADDLLQATVERVLRKGAPDDADIAKWMFRVCRNIWIDEIRTNRAGLAARERSISGAAAFVDGEAAVADRLTLARVTGAMAQLPENQRIALGLFAFGECSYREAAEITGEPIGTIMSRISRARQSLLGILGPEFETDGRQRRQSGKD
jgi:RNA polymerase sigma factor (sigma-70 family)